MDRSEEDIGAGDQVGLVPRWRRRRRRRLRALELPACPLLGLMFGYATDETEECMPLTIVLAHKLNAKLAELRRNGTLPWLRPDSKTQVGSVGDALGPLVILLGPSMAL